MWGKIIVLLGVLGLLLCCSGCSDTLRQAGLGQGRGPGATSPPAPAPKYGIGDIVIVNPIDRIGEVVQSYDPAQTKYSTRTVIMGDFGQVSFYEGGGSHTFGLDDFETRYPYKWGNVDNPFNLPLLKREYSPEYGVGEVATKETSPHQGIMILSYDYPRDTYTYKYVYRQGSAWIPHDDITYTGARTDIEKRYRD
ncbi:MAG TPA: hypothetical protein PLN56_01835 [Methanoregulaceae archaeon]|nr:MAG: hypothetical protein IPI71_02590 [Methanolinea sp.]HON80964.1 hypothetical protein [Methanoregulaceae archaeon]HPD09729.1 hypothetical protein [Methanoregulaceae archaeon]HRT14550.1 hypothetical protein [Methanoregulaceae archaeon]HRU30121.1 hypothetical protein [Methanoregulaceae archaeon]